MECGFKCELSGSFAENTKCFAPDEFDFIFHFQNVINDNKYFSRTLFLANADKSNLN